MDWFIRVFYFCFLIQVAVCETDELRGPPKVEKNPLFSSSFIPAAMQIIAHDTELMKYVIKPSPGTTTTTTTTMRPTRPHKPAVFAPTGPLGPTTYFSKTNVYGEYVQRQQQPSGTNYFDRYYPLIQPETEQGRNLQRGDDIYDEVEKYVGKGFGNVLRLANSVDLDLNVVNDDLQVLEFSKNFEDKDSNYRYEILRQKRVPPTKAYVTLLSLYDLLNKESKRLMLNKFSGYTNDVIKKLVEYSSSTSSYQLRSVLNQIVQNGDTRKADVVTKIKSLIDDLDQEKSYANSALKDIPPLLFSY